MACRGSVWEDYLLTLSGVKSFDDLKQHAVILEDHMEPFDISNFADSPNLLKLALDFDSLRYLPASDDNLEPIQCTGDGSCLFNSISILLCGSEELSKELRVRTILELANNADYFINCPTIKLTTKAEDLLKNNVNSDANYEQLDEETWDTCYRNDTLELSKNIASFADMTCVHALCKIIDNPIKVVYPDIENVNRKYIHRVINEPLHEQDKSKVPVSIMLCGGVNLEARAIGHFYPNHFVPLRSRQRAASESAERMQTGGLRANISQRKRKLDVTKDKDKPTQEQNYGNKSENNYQIIGKSRKPKIKKEVEALFKSKGYTWTDKCEQLFQEDISLKADFESLKRKAGQIYGPNYKKLITSPMTVICPMKTCKGKEINLQRLNGMDQLCKHLCRQHTEKAAITIAHHWKSRSPGQVVSNDLLYQENTSQDEDTSQGEEKEDIHVLASWIDRSIKSGELGERTLFFQQMYSRMLLQEGRQIRWEDFDIVNSFCTGLKDLIGEKPYNLYIGERGPNPTFKTLNHPGPSLSKLSRDKPTPDYGGGLHPGNLGAILKILENSGMFCLTGNNCRVFLTTLCYDSQPLSKGTFIRKSDEKPVIDGIKPTLSMHDLDDIEDVSSFMKDKVKFISEVTEFYLSDIFGNICMNIATYYQTGDGHFANIVNEVLNVQKKCRSCYNCLYDGIACSLITDSRKELLTCDHCLSCSNMCISTKVIYTFSDMETKQRKAHLELNSMNDFTKMDQLSIPLGYGFAFLHIAKALVGYARNWWITDGTSAFNIAMICSLISSSHKTFQLDRRILNFRDRHSDEVAFNTISQKVQSLLEEVQSVTCTIVPDIFRHWTKESQSHNSLKALSPTYIATNRNGDVLWTDANSNLVYHGNRHNPMKIRNYGDLQSSGAETNKSKSGATFQKPTGISIVPDGDAEYAIVADAGTNALYMIYNIKRFHGNKKISVIETVCFKTPPLAITRYKGSSVIVSCAGGKIIYFIELDLKRAKGNILFTLNIKDIVYPSGLAFKESSNKLIIANDSNMLIVTSKKIGSLSNTIVNYTEESSKSYADVTISPDQNIVVSDPKRGKILILLESKDTFTVKTILGADGKQYREGDTRNATFEEPIGLCYNESGLYICCFQSGLKFMTSTKFALKYCKLVEMIYKITGYSKSDRFNPNFKEKLVELQKVAESFYLLNDERKEFLERENVSTENGALYTHTLNCLKTSYTRLEKIYEAFIEYEQVVNNLNFYAFTNESPVEHGFGHGVQQTQYSILTHKQYADQKVSYSRDFIRKCCETSYSHHTTEKKQYQRPHIYSIKAEDIFKAQEQINISKKKKVAKLTEQYKLERKQLKAISDIYKPNPTQSARTKYKFQCGFTPCSIAQPQEKSQESFKGIQYIGDQVSTEDCYNIVAGDIVGVLAGEEYGVQSTDPWWLFKISRDLKTDRPTSRTTIHGYWLDRTGEVIDGKEHFVLLDDCEARIIYGNIMMDKEKDPFIICDDMYDNTASSGTPGILIHEDICQQLTMQVNEAYSPESSDTESDNEISEENGSIDVEDLRSRTRRISTKGHTYKSYRDLLKGN